MFSKVIYYLYSNAEILSGSLRIPLATCIVILHNLVSEHVGGQYRNSTATAVRLLPS